MNAKERSTALLRGMPTDHFPFHPLMMQFAALKAGVPYSRCCLEHEQQCRVMLDCADRLVWTMSARQDSLAAEPASTA